jgi:AcrR family transcriptional regulator
MSSGASTGKRLYSGEIARAALAILDAEGLDALSMRRLADEVGIGTMTLYGHFRSKDELLDAAVDIAADDFEPPRLSGPPRRQLRLYMHAVRAWLLRHPTIVQIRGQEPIVRPSALRISELGMQLLLGLGVPARDAAHAFRLLFTFVFGSVAFSPAEPSAQLRRATAAGVLALPPDEFPALLEAAAGAAAALGGDEPFELGLEVLLDGLEHRFGSG